MFEKVITLLINPDQTDFIQSRYIEQNIRPINDILEQIKLCYISDILLQLDFQKKAFDTTEREFIQRTIALFNFGESIQQWISIIYVNTESAVLNSGLLNRATKQKLSVHAEMAQYHQEHEAWVLGRLYLKRQKKTPTHQRVLPERRRSVGVHIPGLGEIFLINNATLLMVDDFN